MSEYQYYEFQAIDKPLTKAQQDKVRSLSSRADVDARSARFVYNYGDFRGDEEALMWDYYDAMLYMANWGSRHLRLRFPLADMDVEALSEYTVGDTITVSSRNGKLLLELIFHEVDLGVWLEGEGWLSALLELREDIRRGDLRMLYLAWLKAFHEDDGPTHDDIEPSVPAGLGELSDAHRAFIELFDLEPDLVAAAAQASPPLPANDALPPQDKLETALDTLLASAKTRLLEAAQQGELADIEIELGRELRAALYEKPTAAPGQRTHEQLLDVAENIAEQQAEAERQRKQAERLRALNALAEREPQAWQQVEDLCERKIASAYDEAVTLLVQLNELARQRGESIDARLAPLLERWKKRPALLTRLKTHGLI